MTFAAAAEQTASERFFLVNIKPRKFLGVGTDIGGGDYEFDIGAGYYISSVTVNKADEPTWSYSSGILTVTSATDLSDGANIVTIDHDLFVTGTMTRNTDGVSGLPDAEWLPLVSRYPQFSQSIRNIMNGVFTLSNTEVELISTDRWGQSILGENDSLSKAPVKIWACIDNVETNRKIFDGEVASVSYSYGRFSLSVIDVFNRLNDSATFGEHAYILDGSFKNAVVPMTLGKSSPMSIAQGWRHVNAEGAPPGSLKHLSDGYRATLVGPLNPTKDVSTDWTLGRCITGVKRLNFGTIVGNTLVYQINTPVTVDFVQYDISGHTSYTEPGTYYVVDIVFYIELQNINNFNGEIGDYIPAGYLPGSSTIDGGWVSGFGSGLNGSYNLAISAQRFAYNSNLAETPQSSYTVAALSLPNGVIPSASVWVEAGDSTNYNAKASQEALALVPFLTVKKGSCTRYLPFTLFEGNAYTLNGETVKRIDVTVPPSGDINVASCQLKYRFSPDSEMSHGDALKFIVNAAGLETNDTTFSQADTDLSANVSVTFPLNGANAFETYLNAAQSVTTSTLGLLRVNESREVEYELIKNAGAMTVDATRDTVNMIQGDTSTAVDFQDIYSGINFENPQLNGVSELAGGGAKASVSFPKVEQLHRVSRVKTISHCLTSIQSRKNAISGYLSAPTVEYTLSTSSDDLASSIGDVVEITNTAAASDSESAVGIIVGLDQSGNKTTVKINEIRGVP